VPGREELPTTLERSSRKAQETWVKTHDSAVETYGEGERAHRTAYASLKHSYERIGDHWEPKGEKGPSDDQAARTAGSREVPTAGGVHANASKRHLYELARRLDVPGRSRMSKTELVDALKRANDRATRRARSSYRIQEASMSDTRSVPGNSEPPPGHEVEDEPREVPDQDVAPESPTPEPPG
jgi:hypothetical protein